jgi:hypothetical protein
MPQVMRVLVDDPELEVDGFLLPGHVSVITGWKLFEFLADEFGIGGVVAGFSPTDVAQGVLELVRQAAPRSPTPTGGSSRLTGTATRASSSTATSSPRTRRGAASASCPARASACGRPGRTATPR